MKVWYDENNDMLYIQFTENAYNEVINTKVLTLYLDNHGNICSIAIKHAKEKGLIDELIKLLGEITV